MSNLRSKYLYTIPSTSTVLSRRRLYNIRNSRRAQSGTGLNEPSNNTNLTDIKTKDIIDNTKINNTDRVNQKQIETLLTKVQPELTADIPTIGVPLPIIQDFVHSVAEKPSTSLKSKTQQIHPSGIDLGDEFFLIVPETNDQSQELININRNIDDSIPKLVLTSDSDRKEKVVRGQLTKNQLNNLRTIPTIHHPTLSRLDSLELLDFGNKNQFNFDFLELPNLRNIESLNSGGRVLVGSIGNKKYIIKDGRILASSDIDIIDSRELDSPIDSIEFDTRERFNLDKEVINIDNLFDSSLPNSPSFSKSPSLPETPSLIIQNPLSLLEGIKSEEFYNILTNLIKLETPIVNQDPVFPSTGIPLPDFAITTKRPNRPLFVDKVLPISSTDLGQEVVLDTNDVELITPVQQVPNLFTTPVSNSIPEPITHNFHKDSADTELLDSDFFDTPKLEEDFSVPDLNITGLLSNFDFANFNGNNLTNLSQTWKMNNKTATIVLVLLSSLAESMKFNGHGLPQQNDINSRPEPFIPGLFSTPFFPSSTPSFTPSFTPTPLPMQFTTPNPPRLGRPKSISNFCDPMQPPLCAMNATNFCLRDTMYPIFDVNNLIKNDPVLVDKYADVSDQSANDLVAHMSARQENTFDYSFYNPGIYDVTHWIGPEGYLCPSNVEYTTPRRARNVKGEWRVIINDGHFYTQTIRLETCLYPLTPCRLLAPCFKSKCIQKYMYHRLLSMDPCHPQKGLFIDMYRLPAACSCYAPAMLA